MDEYEEWQVLRPPPKELTEPQRQYRARMEQMCSIFYLRAQKDLVLEAVKKLPELVFDHWKEKPTFLVTDEMDEIQVTIQHPSDTPVLREVVDLTQAFIDGFLCGRGQDLFGS